MKKNVLYYCAKKMLVITVLLLGVTGPLQAASVGELRQRAKEYMQETSQAMRQKWNSGRIKADLKEAYKKDHDEIDREPIYEAVAKARQRAKVQMSFGWFE